MVGGGAMYHVNKTLLQVLRTRDGYKRLSGSIELNLFDKEVKLVLSSILKYWDAYYTEHEVINLEILSQRFMLQNKTLTEEERNFYQDIFLLMQDEPDAAIANELIRQLKTMNFSKDLNDLIVSYEQGDEVDLFEESVTLFNQYESDLRRQSSCDWCKAGAQEIIEDAQQGLILKPRLTCLQKSLPDLRTGMQMIVAARPGKGKTSFCAEIIAGVLQQEQVQKSRRPILWMNNEGTALRIKSCVLRSCLRKDFSSIIKMGWDQANAQFEEVIGGLEMLRIYDIHGRDYRFIERLIEKDKPVLVVWDMLDNVKGFNGANGSRTDERLERLYQWARESAVIYDFLSVPTSQVSAEGADMQWIPESFLKDSKTGKQGACDIILTIGTSNKPGFENSRFVYLPKTKSTPVEGFPADCRTEVFFDTKTSSFYEGGK